jgi:hypothetical protein
MPTASFRDRSGKLRSITFLSGGASLPPERAGTGCRTVIFRKNRRPGNAFGLGSRVRFLYNGGSEPGVAGNGRPGGESVRKRQLLLIAMMAAGTATFLIAVLRRREAPLSVPPYQRPDGGEREGEFELFIGS